MAIGVGQSRILGRVHLADMHLINCNQTIQCSFTVLEDNKVDLLFGLDNLKRHQCCIDLVESRLHFNRGEFSVPFLAEGEIKRNMFEAEKEQLLERQRSTVSQGSAQGSPAGGATNDTAVRELMEAGFSEQQVKNALRVCDNNKEHAMNFLLNSSQ